MLAAQLHRDLTLVRCQARKILKDHIGLQSTSDLDSIHFLAQPCKWIVLFTFRSIDRLRAFIQKLAYPFVKVNVE